MSILCDAILGVVGRRPPFCRLLTAVCYLTFANLFALAPHAPLDEINTPQVC